MSEIQVNNLTTGFGTRKLLDRLSFTIEEPCFLALLGHNGCGKTTFFKTVLNFQPFQGDILLKGRNNKAITRKEFPSVIGSLLQLNPITFDIPAEELVVMGRFRYKGMFAWFDKDDYAHAHLAMDRLGLLPLAKKTFSNLSGGEKQMLWIAQLLVQDPDILLLDEPSQHLDLKNRKLIFDVAQDLVAEGKTVLCITHDIHSLFGRKGFILNLSWNESSLESISDQSLEKHIHYLETGHVLTGAKISLD